MNSTPNDTLYWTDVYLKGQEEFLRRWSQMAQGATPAAGFTAAPGPTGMDWFAMFAPQFGGPSADVARKYFGLYDQYLGASRSLWDVLSKSMANPDPAARAHAFMEGAQSLQQPFTQLWSTMFAGAPFGMGPMAAGMAPGAMSGTPGADWMQMLTKGFGNGDTPALGLTRQHQESLQRLRHLATQYFEQQGRLTALWGNIIGEGLKTLGERVAAKLSAGEAIDSVKKLYDLWIESAELAYAKAAHSPEYAKAQADIGNTLAKLRTEQREQYEVFTKQLDLPTREELNTVHKRIKELKTEVRRLTERLEEPTRAANRKPKKG
jgi:class III poly(R)-hydroxyalkanoic acid synthase PhaE subunit